LPNAKVVPRYMKRKRCNGQRAIIATSGKKKSRKMGKFKYMTSVG